MESFEILAEVAIGIAGFGTIAIVLARDRPGWESADLFRTAALLMSSLGGLFLALLPIGLGMTSLAPEGIWRISSGVMAIYIVTFSGIQLRWRRRYLDRKLWFGPVMFTLVVTTMAANGIAQVLNSVGVVPRASAACFYFGVTWFLLYGCIVLARIVFLRPRQS